MAANRETFCDYHHCTLENGSLGAPSFKRARLAPAICKGATACHEAAHAVLSYALGFGVESVSVGVSIGVREGRKTYMLRGEYRSDMTRFNRLVPAGEVVAYSPTILAADVVTAAGPAAEQRYYVEQGAPIDALGASGGRYERLESVAGGLPFYGSGKPQAYRRLVWRRVQSALANETIWCAVTCLARELFDLFPETDDLIEHGETMGGKEAVAIVRAAGVRPGILGYAAKTRPQ